MIEQITTDDGKVWSLSKLTVGDITEFKGYLRYARWHELNAMKEQFPEEIVKQQLDNLFKECAEKVVSDEDFSSNAFALEGASYLLYLSLRRNHQGITRQECNEILTVNNLEDTITKLLTISGMWKEENNIKVKILEDFHDFKKGRTYTLPQDEAQALVRLGIGELLKKTQRKKA